MHEGYLLSGRHILKGNSRGEVKVFACHPRDRSQACPLVFQDAAASDGSVQWTQREANSLPPVSLGAWIKSKQVPALRSAAGANARDLWGDNVTLSSNVYRFPLPG